jgi:hypothetical protein
MYRMIATTMVLVMLPLAGIADAQGRGQANGRARRDVARAQGVPPGQLPPPGQCRVWYEGRPPGQQPRATNCNNAEAIASRDRNARVIYGDDVYDARNQRGVYTSPGERYPGERYPNDGAVLRVPGRNRDPRNAGQYPGGYEDPRTTRYGNVAYDRGYRDGVEKGREDARDNDRYDPTRHSWYKSGTRGYEDEYGERWRYQVAYRDAFEQGYDQGYRTNARTTIRR